MIFGLNRTSVGLKPSKMTASHARSRRGLNRTSVGLKQCVARNTGGRTKPASIEPAWD